MAEALAITPDKTLGRREKGGGVTFSAGDAGHSRSLISLSISSTRDTTSRNSAGLNPVVSRADRFLEGAITLVGVEEDEGADSGTAGGALQG